MPPIINQKTVEAVASVLKIDATQLSEQLLTEVTDVSKQETKITDLISDRKVFTTQEYTTLEDNIGKRKYDEGSVVGKEKLIKATAKEYGLENTTITEYPKLINKIIEQEKAKLGTPTDEVKNLRSEKEALQLTVQQKDTEIAKWQGEIETVRTSTVIQSDLTNALSQIDIEGDKVAQQKDFLRYDFEKTHQIKIEDGRRIVYKDGKKLVDHLQNPVSVLDALKAHAPSVVTVKAPTGRGGESSKNTPLNGDLSKITDGKSLGAYLDSKNIKANSVEAVAIYNEIRSKNPSFKL